MQPCKVRLCGSIPQGCSHAHRLAHGQRAREQVVLRHVRHLAVRHARDRAIDLDVTRGREVAGLAACEQVE